MVAEEFWGGIKRRFGIQCRLCAEAILSVDDAVDAGWIPSYYDDRDVECGPACPDCCERYLRFDEETQTYERIGRLN